MHVPDSHHTDRVGVSAVGLLFHKELGWLFREQQQDFGVDAQVEIVEEKKPTGRLIGIQIKSGASFFQERTAEHIVFRGDLDHLDYWLRHRLPIIVVLYDPSSDAAYWEAVTEANVQRTKKGWKLLVPVRNRLDSRARTALSAVAEGSSYFVRLNGLQFARPWMVMLQEGHELFVTAEEWVNKLSGKGTISLLARDVDGRERVLQDWSHYVFYPGLGYAEALPRFFPWANLSVDEDYYFGHEREQWASECRRYDKEDDFEYETESFEDWLRAQHRPKLRPYEDTGEVASWRLEVTLNEIGEAFLKLDEFLSGADSSL